MGAPLMVHVAAATLALVTGYIAIGVSKGGTLHRRSGLLFVYAMVVMGTLSYVQYKGQQPAWYQVGMVVVPALFAILGARLARSHALLGPNGPYTQHDAPGPGRAGL